MPEIKWNVSLILLRLLTINAHWYRFLLARLQIDSLVHQTSARNVYKALNHLPSKLNDTYHDALQRIKGQPPEHSTLAEQIISWTFYARRPLKLAQLREALAVERGDTALHRSGFHEPSLLLEVCCGLVTAESEDGTIGLVHYSLQQFLTTFWRTRCPDAELRIASTCLEYLCFEVFLNPLENSEQLQERYEKYKFLDYASGHWAEHVGNGFEKDLEIPVLRFLKNDKLLHSVACVNRLYSGDVFEKLSNRTSPLHFTSFWGLTHITSILIRHGADVEARNYAEQTPLALATKNGHYEAALLLLNSGADVDSTTPEFFTPLSIAISSKSVWSSSRSRRCIAKLLLERGADVNMHYGTEGDSPIRTATHKGDYDMVKLLLEYNADLNPSGKNGHTPLLLAVDREDRYMLKLLLLYGADPNGASGGGSVLMNRVGLHKEFQDEEVLTTEPDIDINKLQTYTRADSELVSPLLGTSPLHHAIDLFWEEGIDILIEAGADPRCVDVYGQSCLDLAWPFENLFSRLRQDRAIYSPTSTSSQYHQLTASVRSLIFVIVQSIECHDESNVSTSYSRLGRCLLQLRDLEEARTVFEYRTRETHLGLTHSAQCDSCKESYISGSRFVCWACRNIDLCSDCMAKYPTETPNPRCSDHDFLEVPGPYWNDLKEQNSKHPKRPFVNMRGETLGEWLKRLGCKYSSPEAKHLGE